MDALVKKDIPFDRYSDARYEFDGIAVIWRPGEGYYTFHATQDYHLTIMREHLLEVYRLMSMHKNKRAKIRLEELMHPLMTPLPPLRHHLQVRSTWPTRSRWCSTSSATSRSTSSR